MAYPARAYRTTPYSPKTAPDRRRERRQTAPRRPVNPGKPTDIRKPLKPGEGSQPYNFPKGGGGGGPPTTPPGGGGGGAGPLGWFFGKNPWVQGFKLGWWLGDQLFDAYEMYRERQGGAGPPVGWVLDNGCAPPGSFWYVPNATPFNCGQQAFAASPGNALPGVYNGTYSGSGFLYQTDAGVVGSNPTRIYRNRWKKAGAVVPSPYSPPMWRPYWRHPGYTHPMVRPIGQPLTHPAPRPYVAPVDPMPEGHQAEEPKLLPDPPISYYVQVGVKGVYQWKAPPSPRRPPPGRVKERKMKLNKGLALVVRILNNATEVGDFIDSLYGGINDGPCKSRFRTPGKPATLLQKAQAVYSCIGQMDWDTAIWNLVWNDIEDRIWAKFGIGTKEFARPYGSNIGVNQVINEAYGSKAGDYLGDAEDWVRQNVAKALGVTLNG